MFQHHRLMSNADYKNLQNEISTRRSEWAQMSEIQILEDFIPVYENFKKAFKGNVNKQYHTSPEEFEIFDLERSPSKSAFFTPDKEYSEKFGRLFRASEKPLKTKEYYLNVNKPLDVNDANYILGCIKKASTFDREAYKRKQLLLGM